MILKPLICWYIIRCHFGICGLGWPPLQISDMTFGLKGCLLVCVQSLWQDARGQFLQTSRKWKGIDVESIESELYCVLFSNAILVSEQSDIESLQVQSVVFKWWDGGRSKQKDSKIFNQQHKATRLIQSHRRDIWSTFTCGNHSSNWFSDIQFHFQVWKNSRRSHQ